MDPKLIVNNALKDLYRARIPLIGFLAVLLFRFIFVMDPFMSFGYSKWLFSPPGDVSEGFSAITYGLMILIGIIVITGWVQSDSLNDNEAFWITRPAREIHLLVAKLANIGFVFILIPSHLDMTIGLLHGAGWNAFWALPNNLWYYSLHFLPILLAATLTPDLPRMILVLIVTIVVASFWTALIGAPISNEFNAYLNNIWEAHLQLILGIAFLAAYLVQSLLRRRKTATKIALAGILLAPLIAFPRFSHSDKELTRKAVPLKDVELDPAEYVYQGWNRERWDLIIDRRFDINDTNPNRILIPLKTQSELVGQGLGRQEHSIRWSRPNWRLKSFFNLLQNTGYSINGISQEDPDYQRGNRVTGRLLDFGRRERFGGFSGKATLDLTNYFSQYELISLKEAPLDEHVRVLENGISSIILYAGYRSQSIEGEEYDGKALSDTKIKVLESRFAESFNSIELDHNEAEIENRILRFYFLYDPTRELLAAGHRQFNNQNRDFHYYKGLWTYGPNLSKREKWMTFRMHHNANYTIDHKQLKLLVIDMKKTGNSVLKSEMEISDLSKHVKAIRELEQSNAGMGRWTREVDP